MAPVSARRYISPRSDTTGAAAVWTLIRLSPEDEVYLSLAKEVTYSTEVRQHFFKPCPVKSVPPPKKKRNRQNSTKKEQGTVDIKRKRYAP